jgi:hypothetical protein
MTTPNIAPVLRRGALLHLGVVLVGAAPLCAEAAWLHMRELVRTTGVICGSGASVVAHCPACYASVVFLASGLAALIAAQAEPLAALSRARSTPSA